MSGISLLTPGSVTSASSECDLSIAQKLVARLTEAGQGRVRRVVMIGSRARGDATPESDLDLVVLVELPRDAAPWGPRETSAERLRLQREVGPPPLKTDLWVRTTDQFAEASTVIGGVEWLAATEGVTLFERAPGRPPIIRRTREQVRWGHVRSWLSDAATALSQAQALSANEAEARARKSLRCALNAALVRNSIASAKRDSLGSVLERLRLCEPALASVVSDILDSRALDPAVAGDVAAAVFRRLNREPASAPYMTDLGARLSPCMATRH